MTHPNSIVIPGYRIERKLGQGGMATVYLAIQQSFDREVALKIMSPFLNSDPSFTTRFVREARIVAQIHHASIVPVMDVGEHQTHHYLSMEYLPGGDLKHRIAENKHGLSLAVSTCLAISGALDVAHRKGFVHRDIKPENILFREDDTPVLTDFGIARAIDAGTSLTLAGMMVGTPNYMSPEQVKGHELDGRSDLYSLGIVFYELLTGNVPFRADSTMSLALKHLSDPLPPLPPQFAIYQPFIDRLTAKEREDRFASGAEVARALRLIHEMANPRMNPALHPALSPTLTSVLSPSVSSLQSQPSAAYETTLLPPRRAATLPALSSATFPEPAVAAQPNAPAPTNSTQAVTPSAALRWAALVAVLKAVATHAWMKLRGPTLLAPPASPAPAASLATPALHTDTGGSDTALGRWQQTSTTRSRRAAVWAALAVCVVTLSFSAYLFSRGAAPVPRATLTPPARAPVSAAPVRATQSQATAVPPAAPTVSAEEVLGLVQRIGAERATLASVQTLFTRAAVRVATKERRAKEEAARLAAATAARAEETRQANEAKIKQLLLEAQSDIADGRIYLPAGFSAADRYLEARKINETHPEVLAASQRIVELLAAESDRYLKIGNAMQAETLVARLRVMQPQHPQLAALEMRLQSSQPVELTRGERNRLSYSTKRIGKANDELDKKRLNLRELDLASDAYQDAAKELPESPGLETLRQRIVVSFAAAAKAQLDENDLKEAKKLLEMARKRDLTGPDLEYWAGLINANEAR